MFSRVLNLFKLIALLRERGNWPLIRRSRRQLWDFVLCRNEMNPKSILRVPFYWWHWLEGFDVLVWRLETFGFLFLPESSAEDRTRLNRYL